MKKSIFTFMLAVLFIAFLTSGKIMSQGLEKDYANNSKSDSVNLNEEPKINTFILVEKEPVPQKIVSPIYPELAIKAGVKGSVYVRVLIDKTGKPKDALIIKSAADMLNNSVIQAALGSTFTPAVKNGENISCWKTLIFSFKR